MLAASSAPEFAVIALLPEGVSGARSSFLSGFALGQDEARACGIDPVSVSWQTIGADSDALMPTGSETALVVAKQVNDSFCQTVELVSATETFGAKIRRSG